MPDERINSIKTPNYTITPNINYYGTKIRVEFNGSCLKQDSVTFNHGRVVNIYIAYEISQSINIRDYPTLENCLFGAVSRTKNADIDRYKYFEYGLGRKVAIFGIDMTSSTKIDNRKKDILILGKGPTQGLEHTLSAEKTYSINFAKHNKKFCLSCIIMEQTVIYLLMVKKFINSKQKILRL